MKSFVEREATFIQVVKGASENGAENGSDLRRQAGAKSADVGKARRPWMDRTGSVKVSRAASE